VVELDLVVLPVPAVVRRTEWLRNAERKLAGCYEGLKLRGT